MPKCDFLGNGEEYLQELIQSDFDVEDEGRCKVEVKELKENNEGKALLYAVEKTAERTKREIIDKAVKWMYNYFVIDHYGMTSAGFGLFELAFKKAMQDESRRLD